MIDRDEAIAACFAARMEWRGGGDHAFDEAIVDRILALDRPRNGDLVWPDLHCGCGRCDAARRASLPPAQQMMMFMITCPLCGNKRCPHAAWHGYECTRSNESGQVPVPILDGP